VDQAQDRDLTNLDGTTVRRMFTDYENKRGGMPQPEHEPTTEQISAVAQLIHADLTPYADFSVFGPQGRRVQKKLMFQAQNFCIDSQTWKKVELPGPSDLPTWWKCWLVYQTTMLLGDWVSAEPLAKYGEFIRNLLEQFGPSVWFIVYQADIRMRSEQFERIRRDLQIGYDRTPIAERAHFPIDPQRPWNAVFTKAVDEAYTPSQAFWRREANEKCFMFLARLRTAAALTDDGMANLLGGEGKGKGKRTRQRGWGSSAEKASPGGPGKQTQPAKGSPGGKANPPGGKQQNGKGTDTCRKFNEGTCSGAECPNGYIHKCKICGTYKHGASQCRQPGGGQAQPKEAPSWGSGKEKSDKEKSGKEKKGNR